MYPYDYYAHLARAREREALARAAVHRLAPPRARRPARWRRPAARVLLRLARRLEGEPALAAEQHHP